MDSAVWRRSAVVLCILAHLMCCPALRAEAVWPEQVSQAADMFLRMRQARSSNASASEPSNRHQSVMLRKAVSHLI